MNKEYSVFISAGSVVLMSSNMEEQDRQDVLYSTLFAQLVSNKRISASAAPDAWYDSYLDVLGNAWLLPKSSWSHFSPEQNKRYKIFDWVRHMLGEIQPSETVDTSMRALRVLENLSDSTSAAQLLRAHIKSAVEVESSDKPIYKVRLQVIFASAGPSITNVYIEFQTTEAVRLNPMMQKFSADKLVGDVVLKSFEAGLSELLYEKQRSVIVTSLGDRKTEKIMDITKLINGESHLVKKGGLNEY